jgi:hypothetical protein
MRLRCRAFENPVGEKLLRRLISLEISVMALSDFRISSGDLQYHARVTPYPDYLAWEAAQPTRYALTAAAWGEAVPKTVAAARRIAAKGRRLLKRYEKMKKRN